MQKYRPSNATEYNSFYSGFCAKCAKNINENCQIISDSMVFDIDAPEYPDALVVLEMPTNSDDNRYYATCIEFEVLRNKL